MSSSPYEDILKRADALSPEQLLKLSEELSQKAGRKNGPSQHSILELDGLGKELWKDIDPDKFVAKERDAWDG